VNSGNSASDYGYWFHGAEDDGAAGWGFNPAKYGTTWIPDDPLQPRGLWPYDGEIDNGFSGALRSAATIVAKDPVFGLVAYGGCVQKRGSVLEVELHDGLEQRLELTQLPRPISVQIDGGGFLGKQQIEQTGQKIRLRLQVESRDNKRDEAILELSGLPPGSLLIVAQDGKQSTLKVGNDGHCSQTIRFTKMNQPAEITLQGNI
jgi:hypothetical protein